MAETSENMLPEEFSDLEPFARMWALSNAEARYQRRLASTMEEIQDFYDAMIPRGEEAMAYLDQFELDDVPDTVLHLYWMLSSLIVVSFAVEIFRQPKVPDTGAAYLKWVVEPGP
jgi:hypothetical protein